MASPPYALEFYADVDGNEPVLDWLRRLAPRKRRAMGVAMFEILQFEGPQVVGTNFGKWIGGGIFEFRLDQDAPQVLRRQGKQARPEDAEPSKILLRVFCHAHGQKIVLLLAGYDKAWRPGARYQNEQIQVAKLRLKDWRARQGSATTD